MAVLIHITAPIIITLITTISNSSNSSSSILYL